ncbi:unnamed protein product, partial [Musa textilis]
WRPSTACSDAKYDCLKSHYPSCAFCVSACRKESACTCDLGLQPLPLETSKVLLFGGRIHLPRKSSTRRSNIVQKHITS